MSTLLPRQDSTPLCSTPSKEEASGQSAGLRQDAGSGGRSKQGRAGRKAKSSLRSSINAFKPRTTLDPKPETSNPKPKPQTLNRRVKGRGRRCWRAAGNCRNLKNYQVRLDVSWACWGRSEDPSEKPPLLFSLGLPVSAVQKPSAGGVGGGELPLPVLSCACCHLRSMSWRGACGQIN